MHTGKPGCETYVCLLRAAKVFPRRHSSIKMHHPRGFPGLISEKYHPLRQSAVYAFKTKRKREKERVFKLYLTISRKTSASVKLFKYLYECARSSSRLRSFLHRHHEDDIPLDEYVHARTRITRETNWNFKQTHGRNKTQRPLYAG